MIKGPSQVSAVAVAVAGAPAAQPLRDESCEQDLLMAMEVQ